MTGYNNFEQSGGYQNQQAPRTGYPNMDSIFNPGGVNQNNVPRLNRNYIIVTSLQEALGKESPYNSKGLYVHQDGEYEFEIFTDSNGRKTYDIYKRINCTNEQDAMSIPKSQYDELSAKIKKLEEAVYGKSTSNATDGATTL
jgi:hypothetical protein